MSMQRDQFYIRHRVNELQINFNVVPCLVVQDIEQLKYRLFLGQTTLIFYYFLTYSFVFFYIREYEN